MCGEITEEGGKYSTVMQKALQEVEKFGETLYEIKAYQNDHCILKYRNMAYLAPDKWSLMGISIKGEPLYATSKGLAGSCIWVAKACV